MVVVVVLIAVSEKSTPLVVFLIEERERECGEIHSCVSFERFYPKLRFEVCPILLICPSAKKKTLRIIAINRVVLHQDVKKIVDLTSLENATTSCIGCNSDY